METHLNQDIKHHFIYIGDYLEELIFTKNAL